MSEPEELTDEQLFRRMEAGDAEAFTALYRRRQGGIYRFSLKMSGSTALAEEATQEVFMALIRANGTYDPDRGPVAAFLFGIARNVVLRHLERDRWYMPYEADENESQNGNGSGRGGQDANGYDPLGDLTRAESIEQLRQAVLALPVKYREVVVLCDLEELSYLEAARALDCAVGSVRSRLHRARSLLLRKMKAAASAERTAAQGWREQRRKALGAGESYELP